MHRHEKWLLVIIVMQVSLLSRTPLICPRINEVLILGAEGRNIRYRSRWSESWGSESRMRSGSGSTKWSPMKRSLGTDQWDCQTRPRPKQSSDECMLVISDLASGHTHRLHSRLGGSSKRAAVPRYLLIGTIGIWRIWSTMQKMGRLHSICWAKLQP